VAAQGCRCGTSAPGFVIGGLPYSVAAQTPAHQNGGRWVARSVETGKGRRERPNQDV
jgi:hypothetical protein